MLPESLPFRVIRANADDEVIARAANLIVGRAAYETAVRLYPKDLIEYREGARVIACRDVPKAWRKSDVNRITVQVPAFHTAIWSRVAPRMPDPAWAVSNTPKDQPTPDFDIVWEGFEACAVVRWALETLATTGLRVNGNVIVWDLETVPDQRAFAAANGLSGKTDEEIRQAIGDKFPKHIYHSIICIGALVAHHDQGRWLVGALGAPHVGERSEKELITAFVDKIAELNPQLITFNGNTFDLPVLRYRAMINHVSAPGLASRLYFNRYTEDALDLCDALSSFSAHAKASLNEMSKVMGLRGKPDGVDGSDVHRFFLEGNIKEIADYCETDVVNTYQIWLRYELFRGRLNRDGHEASERSLAEFIEAREGTKPHLSKTRAEPPYV